MAKETCLNLIVNIKHESKKTRTWCMPKKNANENLFR
jgi:hypothetical protein